MTEKQIKAVLRITTPGSHYIVGKFCVINPFEVLKTLISVFNWGRGVFPHALALTERCYYLEELVLIKADAVIPTEIHFPMLPSFVFIYIYLVTYITTE
jgi:hypothetical protein